MGGRVGSVLDVRGAVHAPDVPGLLDHGSDLQRWLLVLDVRVDLLLLVRFVAQRESLGEAKRELTLDVAEVDEERSGKDGRAAKDGVEVDPSRRRAGQPFGAPDLFARRPDLPAGGRPAEA